MNIVETKRVINYCKNYYDIIEERFAKDDILSKEIIEYYKYAVSNTNANDIDELNRVSLIDNSVYAYFNNNKFNELIIESIQSIDKQSDLGDFLISMYQRFANDPNNKVVTTRWL